jgi:hypothetical protein
VIDPQVRDGLIWPKMNRRGDWARSDIRMTLPRLSERAAADKRGGDYYMMAGIRKTLGYSCKCQFQSEDQFSTSR